MGIARRLAYWFATVVGGTLLTMATVTPAQADTAVSGWLEVLGWQNPPAQLVSENANTVVFVVGVIFLLIALFGVYEWLAGRKKPLATPADEIFRNEKARLDALMMARAAHQASNPYIGLTGPSDWGGAPLEPPKPSPTELLKARLRDLLKEIDVRIPSEIDRGVLQIDTRMTTRQYETLKGIFETDGIAKFVAKGEETGRLYGSMINNGSFGPATAEREQVRMKITFKRDLMA